MNTSVMQNYDTTPAPGNPTLSEAWALTQAALRMQKAAQGGAEDDMCLAVRLNWRLWTVFQADLLAPTCQLPEGLRVNMLSLAQFIDKHSVAFMASPSVQDLDVLININREISGGLRDSAQLTQAEANARSEEAAGAPGGFNSADLEA